MAYNHGVKVSEKPTSILPPVSVSAGIPFVVGTAPVNMSDVSNVNKPVLCNSYAEAVAAFGHVPPIVADASGLKKYEYSISQFIYSQFALFGASPVIIVNVLDPAIHKKASNVTAVTLDADGSAVIPESGIIKSSVSLGSGGGSVYHGEYIDEYLEYRLDVTAKQNPPADGYVFVLHRGRQSHNITVYYALADGPEPEPLAQQTFDNSKQDLTAEDLAAMQVLDGQGDPTGETLGDRFTFSGYIPFENIQGGDSLASTIIPLYTGTKAHARYEGTFGSLEVYAAEPGESGDGIFIKFRLASETDKVEVSLYVNDVLLGSALANKLSYGDVVAAEELNSLMIDGEHITNYVEFYGELELAGIPAYDSGQYLTITLSGGADASGSGSAYVEGEDYAAAFDDDGYLVITSLKNTDGTYKIPTGTAIEFSAQKLNPAAVDVGDVIGGVDVSGNKSGFELVDECFPRFRLVPGLLLAPGYSGNAGLAAVMAAKAANINQEFTALALIDVPTESVGKYSEVAEWKNTNSITDPRQIVCWPGVALDGVYYDLSVQLAGAIAITDSENEDVPYVSPSNHAINATASVLASGEEVWIAPDTGAYLNGQGVVTALNFIGGWVAWGNRTACYPANTDVKDSFIPVKRMFAWVGNTIIQTYWSKVDAPLNRRLIDTILDSVNLWLNGLAARQYIIGGRVEFNPDENPSPDLLDGIARFHVYITPASPARELDFILEYDPAYLANLFA